MPRGCADNFADNLKTLVSGSANDPQGMLFCKKL